jgi:hypothetical protein
LKKRLKVLEIVKREASVTSIRAGTIRVVDAKPTQGRIGARRPLWGGKVAASTLGVCARRRGTYLAQKRFGKRWVGPWSFRYSSRSSSCARGPRSKGHAFGRGNPRSPRTGRRASTCSVRIPRSSARGILPCLGDVDEMVTVALGSWVDEERS